MYGLKTVNYYSMSVLALGDPQSQETGYFSQEMRMKYPVSAVAGINIVKKCFAETSHTSFSCFHVRYQ